MAAAAEQEAEVVRAAEVVPETATREAAEVAETTREAAATWQAGVAAARWVVEAAATQEEVRPQAA